MYLKKNRNWQIRHHYAKLKFGTKNWAKKWKWKKSKWMKSGFQFVLRVSLSPIVNKEVKIRWQWNYDRPKQPWNGIVNDWYMRMGDWEMQYAITTMIGYFVCRLCDMMRPILYVHFLMLSAGWIENRFYVHSCGKCINVPILDTCKRRLKSQRKQNLLHSLCHEPLCRLLVFFLFENEGIQSQFEYWKSSILENWLLFFRKRELFTQFPPSFYVYIDSKSIYLVIEAQLVQISIIDV